MKLQLKSIAAAALLVVVAGHAAAAAMPLNNAATGSSLLFYAFDDVTKTSYVQDLGLTYSSFLPATGAAATNANYGISSNTAWSDYLASVADTSNTYWGVISGISANAGSSSNGLLSTVRAGDSSVGQTTATAKSAVAGPLRNVFIGINGATNLASTTASTGYFSASAAGDNIANNFQHNGFGKLIFNVDNLIGTSAAFQSFNSNIAAGGTAATTTYANAFGNSTFSFDGANLSYAVAVSPVPEPSSYAMMLGGLMLVGGIAARRRNSAK